MGLGALKIIAWSFSTPADKSVLNAKFEGNFCVPFKNYIQKSEIKLNIQSVTIDKD